MVNNIDISIKCQECSTSGNGIYIDVDIGELVCKKCGLVLPDFIWIKDEIYEK